MQRESFSWGGRGNGGAGVRRGEWVRDSGVERELELKASARRSALASPQLPDPGPLRPGWGGCRYGRLRPAVARLGCLRPTGDVVARPWPVDGAASPCRLGSRRAGGLPNAWPAAACRHLPAAGRRGHAHRRLHSGRRPGRLAGRWRTLGVAGRIALVCSLSSVHPAARCRHVRCSVCACCSGCLKLAEEVLVSQIASLAALLEDRLAVMSGRLPFVM